MKDRVLYLVKTYFLTVLVFIVAKVLFMLYNHSGHDFSISDVGQVVWNGLTLDLSMSLYLLAIPLLAVIFSLWVQLPRWVLKGYYVVIAVGLALAFTADMSLYPFWGFKLNAACLQYLESPKEAMASVSIGYLVNRKRQE